MQIKFLFKKWKIIDSGKHDALINKCDEYKSYTRNNLKILMILIYRFLTNLTYPLIVLIIFLRKYKRKEDKTRYKEKLFSKYFNVKRDHNKKLFWFHAASVGEFKSIIPIIKELNKEQKNLEFLVTTVTLSSVTWPRCAQKF